MLSIHSSNTIAEQIASFVSNVWMKLEVLNQLHSIDAKVIIIKFIGPNIPFKVCGYVCHKACRKEVHVSCTKVTGGSFDDEDKTDVRQFTEKIDTLEKRIKSIQNEVEIEARILDGLLKMGQAKASIKEKDNSKLLKKKTIIQGPDMHDQIEKSSKKLELFRNEKIKCQQQIDSFKLEEKAVSERNIKPITNALVDFKNELSKQVSSFIHQLNRLLMLVQRYH